MFTTVLTFFQIKDLEPLKPVLKEDDYFPMKITIRSNFEEYCKHIKKGLIRNEFEILKKTQFGHLLTFPKQYQHSSQMMWYFVLRQIQTKKKKEMWMMVNSTPMRFSMEDYQMITGLNFTHVSDREKIKDEASHNVRLATEFFGRKKINIDNLVCELEKKPVRTKKINYDKVKTALLLFLTGVLFGYEKKTPIEDWIVGLVDDIEVFDRFDWGVESYKCTLAALRKDVKAKLEEHSKNKAKTYMFLGFIHAFQV